VASKDGSGTVGDTIRSAAHQADVYVVSDGSTDATAAVARDAGAQVLELEENVGKPAALYRAVEFFDLATRYVAIAILDDDTVIGDEFVAEAMKRMDRSVAIVVGRTITRWDHARRWNVWLGVRAYSYWRYQISFRRGQSAFNLLNCISGSNSVYRSRVLAQVLRPQTPYIVDDTYWTLETHRRKLGWIVYAPRAHAFIQDPTTLRDWYRQNVRWLWGTFQGIRGHRCGLHRSWFDLAYLALMADWILYVFGGPVAIALVAFGVLWSPLMVVLFMLAGYLAWIVPAAVALRKWRLLVMAPVFILIDWLYRVVFLHAAAKAVRQPVVASCKWESPARY
jgi:cellulose synthase/poly-beta-1,6-N-acetylglucosamine synthase-like glycosyltransferase